MGGVHILNIKKQKEKERYKTWEKNIQIPSPCPPCGFHLSRNWCHLAAIRGQAAHASGTQYGARRARAGTSCIGHSSEARGSRCCEGVSGPNDTDPWAPGSSRFLFLSLGSLFDTPIDAVVSVDRLLVIVNILSFSATPRVIALVVVADCMTNLDRQDGCLNINTRYRKVKILKRE